ncbi:MAG: Rrf2 family transcriptional regulator [Deltaproteobacteria bacterium]|nr:Rrf2 family transcriptional regulator [Deltaproteobacteria bacterium]
MKLSRKCEYALTIVLDLSNYYELGREHSRVIAQRRNIPRKYIERILLQLIKGGIVQSKKGPKGGYRLTRPPDKIMMGEVIRLMDPPLFPAPDKTLKNLVDEDLVDRIGFFGVFEEVAAAIAEVIDHISFADIRKREASALAKENKSYTYHI